LVLGCLLIVGFSICVVNAVCEQELRRDNDRLERERALLKKRILQYSRTHGKLAAVEGMNQADLEAIEAIEVGGPCMLWAAWMGHAGGLRGWTMQAC
jgi:transposase